MKKEKQKRIVIIVAIHAGLRITSFHFLRKDATRLRRHSVYCAFPDRFQGTTWKSSLPIRSVGVRDLGNETTGLITTKRSRG